MAHHSFCPPCSNNKVPFEIWFDILIWRRALSGWGASQLSASGTEPVINIWYPSGFYGLSMAYPTSMVGKTSGQPRDNLGTRSVFAEQKRIVKRCIPKWRASLAGSTGIVH